MTSHEFGNPFGIEQSNEPAPNFAVLTPFEFLADFRLEAQNAKRRIFAQAMAIQAGHPGQVFFHVLEETAKRGIDTRLNIDHYSDLISEFGNDDGVFYADDAWDLEINMNSLGWEEFCGIHDRTNYDLKQHETFSKTKMQAQSESGKETPHILEIAFGTDRAVMAIMDASYEDDKERGNKVLHFKSSIAPIQVGVFSLVNKINEKSLEVYESIKEDFICVFDKSGSIGRRYARADELGIPYCVTVDFDSLEKEDVTIRDRDTTEQIRVNISELKKVLSRLLKGEVEFKSLK